MAGKGRRSARDLIDELREDGPRFEFFQAVRLLALSAREGEVAPELPPTLRFATPLSLAFPASEILEVAPLAPAGPSVGSPAAALDVINIDTAGGGKTERDKAASVVADGGDNGGDNDGDNGDESSDADVATDTEQALRMTIGFLGLTGPSGVLPTAYTELLIERRNLYRDTAAHQFMEMFAHRATSLFYRAWRKHRFYLGYEAGERDGFTRNTLDLTGSGLTSLRARLAAKSASSGLPESFFAHFSGLMAQKPRSPATLAALIRGYFKVKVHIEQFVGQWMQVPPDEQSMLGAQSCLLGESAVAGARLWERQTKMCVSLGPLSAREYDNFLPGQTGALILRELVQCCVGQTLACDVQLTLRKEEAPRLQVGGSSRGSNETGGRLGHNAWLRSRPLADDPSDARFSLLA